MRTTRTTFARFLRERIRTGRVFRKLDLMPRNSIRDTVRLDTLEAPAKELARQIKQTRVHLKSQSGPSTNPRFILSV
jgi:hypothetical protein